MFAQISWKGKFGFEGKTESGHSVFMDVKPDSGGENQAPSPMELVIVALGGCTGMDVVLILKKMKVDLESMTINIDYQGATDHPKVFTKINLEYNFTGRNIKEEDVKRAIELSRDKYCSISAMLKEKVEISYKWNIINK